MATPHNEAVPGQIADIVLMPGDPLRAKMIAENFLENVELVSRVRNIYAFTGTYKGRRVTVMASGMGMPSIGIYSYELYKFYGVESIIRIGSAGSYVKELAVGDVALCTEAWTESSFALVQSGKAADKAYPSKELNEKLTKAAEINEIRLMPAVVHSSDVFYVDPENAETRNAAVLKAGCQCVEMESFALFHNAKSLGKKAACLLTISDSFVTGEEMTADERQNTLTNMIRIALESSLL